MAHSKSRLMNSVVTALCIASIAGLPACSGPTKETKKEPVSEAESKTPINTTHVSAPYSLKTEWFSQPVDHDNPDAGSFRQQVLFLTPENVTNHPDIMFVFGNENDATEAFLEKFANGYGVRDSLVYVMPEHRGYGQSITEGDQTSPEYVSVKQALADYHAVISEIKSRYSRKIMGAGCSYGGSLAINFASEYADDLDVVLASSAPIDWPFVIPEYSKQVEINLGERFTQRLNAHMINLEPQALYDDNWVWRERLTALTTAMSQNGDAQQFIPIVRNAAELPTPLFTQMLETSFPDESIAELDKWAKNRIAQPVSYEMAKTGAFNWHTWKYQQCHEFGSFFSGYPFTQSESDHLRDCAVSFGGAESSYQGKSWPVASHLSQISIPIVVVTGGRDPWKWLGVRPGHTYSNIDFVYIEDGFHCPDRGSPEIGHAVFEKLHQHAVSGN